MSITFAQAKTIISDDLGESDADTLTFIGQMLDQAQKDVAKAHQWACLTGRKFVNTVNDYSTGTVTVTNASATVTGSGTVFPAAVATAAYRFALSATSQWYTVTTRGGDTSLTLAENYVGTTAAGSAYVLYKSVYVLASDVGRVKEMWLHNGTEQIPLAYQPGEAWATDFNHFPTGLGRPTNWALSERDSSGNVQVLLGPYAPDAEYRIEYTYRKRITEGSFVLDDDLTDLIIQRAMALVYKRDHYPRFQAEQSEYLRMLKREIASSSDVGPDVFVVGQGRDLGDGTGWLEGLVDRSTEVDL